MGNSGISHKTRETPRSRGFSLEVPMKSKLLLLSLLFLLSSVTLTSTVRTLQAPCAAMTVAFGPKQYIGAAGPPETFTETFQHCGTSPCQIVVVNGKADGTQRISSASISLNGQQIVGPADFNQQTGRIAKAVVLAGQNQLSITLRSRPGSFLTVSVECLAPAAILSASAPGATLLNGNGLSCNGSCTALHGFGNRAMAVETRTRQLETQLRQFHIQTSHQTPEIARAQAQWGSRNLKVAGGIDYGAPDESPLEVIDARSETAGRI